MAANFFLNKLGNR